MIRELIEKVLDRKDLTQEEATTAMDCIMEGEATPAQIGSFLTALRMKGETAQEITGFAVSMRGKAARIMPDVPFLVDTCGTGGDKAHTFNISTGAAVIAPAAGVSVAKHGNRSVSSKCGSADVLEALNVNILIPQEAVCRCIEETGFGFMFAPAFHGAMKHAAGARREMGFRTVFNILGPLTNPAGAQGQLLGVFNPPMTELMAQVLQNLGTEHALVINSEDGMDEISVCAKTKITELKNGRIETYFVSPEDFGIPFGDRKEITGGDPGANARMILSILKGEKGARRDILVLNAGAAIYAGKGAQSIQEGVLLAREALRNGSAYRKLQEMIEFTGAYREAAAK